MTAEPDLLPSSVAAFIEALHGGRGSLDAWLEVNDEREVRAHVEAYAHANVAHATAAKDAEIEALRELCGMAYQLAGVHDAPEKWLDALSNAAAGRPFSTDGLLPYWPQAVCEAEARADKLRAEVEMLRDAFSDEDMTAGAHWFGRYVEQKRRAERLAEALRERRDWFEAQAKSISKGNGSSWDLMQVREQRDLCDAALDQEPGREQ